MADLRVMVVEDQRVVSRIIEEVLNQFGCGPVLVLTSGEEAVDRIEDFKPDLILMDIWLQREMNGIDAARRILDRDRIPMVFVTAHADDGLAEFASEGYPFSFVLKPFDSQTLKVALEIALSRARVDQSLRESEERYQNLTEGLRQVVYTADPKTFVTTYINRAVEDVFGYTVREWQDDPALWENNIHPEDREKVFLQLEEAIGAGKNPVLEYRIVSRDRQIRWVSDRVTLRMDDRGNPVSISGIVYDITERKLAESAIVNAKRQWEETFDAVSDSVMILDERYRIVRVNRAMAEKVALHPKEVLGRCCYEYVHGTKGPPDFCPFKSVMADGRPRSQQFYSGVLGAHCSASCSRMSKDDEEKRGVCILRDISRHKRLEKAIVEIADQERNRIGREIHDGLSQELTGVSFLCRTLEILFKDRSFPEAGHLERIGELLNGTIETTQRVIREISPVHPTPEGLESALRDLAAGLDEEPGQSCIFQCEHPVPIDSNVIATHLYRIAQQAVRYAIEMAGADHIEIALNRMENTLFLSIESDGLRFRGKIRERYGLGLEMIQYRANMLQAALEVVEKKTGGGILTLRLSLEDHQGENGNSERK